MEVVCHHRTDNLHGNIIRHKCFLSELFNNAVYCCVMRHFYMGSTHERQGKITC